MFLRCNCMTNKKSILIHHPILCGMLTLILVFLAQSSQAVMFDVAGRPLNFMGYINQSVTYNIGDDSFDHMDGFQSMVMQALVEAEYLPTDQLRIFASVQANVDWAYSILSDDSEWEDKGFDGSKDRLHYFDQARDFIKELNVTWTPGNFFFRIGKQVVVWGETDAVRIMDQFNPVDTRRGLTDIEFETSIVPIWLCRLEYQPGFNLGFLEELGIQFVFNPNADFEGNQDKGIYTGNDVSGIWTPLVQIPLGGPYPMDFAYLGSNYIENIEQIDDWDSDGYEYGIRINSIVMDGILTLNYFNGVENAPAIRAALLPPMMMPNAWDGRMVMQLPMEGFFPDLEFAGLTYSRDLYFMSMSALGNVSPVLRLEGQYVFDRTFVNALNSYEEFDQIRWAMGLDWKVRISLLNPLYMFSVSGQVIHEHTKDYPTGGGLMLAGAPVKENMWTTTLRVATTYFHSKINPSFTWMRTFAGPDHGDLYKYEVIYERDYNWNFTLGAAFFGDENFGPFDNKDHIYFTIAYRF